MRDSLAEIGSRFQPASAGVPRDLSALADDLAQLFDGSPLSAAGAAASAPGGPPSGEKALAGRLKKPQPGQKWEGWGRTLSVRRLQRFAAAASPAIGIWAAARVPWLQGVNLVGLAAILPATAIFTLAWPRLMGRLLERGLAGAPSRAGERPVLRAGALNEESDRLDYGPFQELIRREGFEPADFFFHAVPSPAPFALR